MPLIDPILDELTREAETTRRLLSRVPTDKLAWKPHEKSRSLGELAWHLAVIPKRIATMVPMDEADILTVKQPPLPATAGEIVESFERFVADAREILSKLPDESLSRKFRMRRGETTVAHLPKLAFLRTVLLNHSYHHRGQLSVYLRLLNIPVPPIYGPTADESL